MDNPFELNAVFRFTQQGATLNQNTGLINARALRNLHPQENFMVLAFNSTDHPNEIMIQFVSQETPAADGEVSVSIMRLSTALRYYRNGWIMRTDRRNPEKTFPLFSVWKITQAGVANIQNQRWIRNPTHHWRVREIYLDPVRSMRMTITLDNETSRENGREMQCKFDIGMFFYWLSEGYIERLDDVSRPSSPMSP